METVRIYSNGIVHCSVCVPKDMSREAIEGAVNLQNPTGVSTKWKIDESGKFADGTLFPAQCEEDATRFHWLMVC